jgi:exopolysaccharide production protein ExoZ
MGKLLNVEAGRGLAALLVVFYHANKYYFSTPNYWVGSAFRGIFAFGHSGVEFFFVLSGFIMLRVHRNDIGVLNKSMSFVRKRFLRIYPFFWLMLLITVALYAVLPQSGKAIYRMPMVVIQSALLAGIDPKQAVLFPSWTLWHEILFYVICALVIKCPRIGITVFVIWTCICGVLCFINITPTWPSYITEFINVLFAVGVGCAMLVTSIRIPMPRSILAVGCVIFIATGLYTDYGRPLPDWLIQFLFGSGSALALLGGVEAERSGLLVAPKWLVQLGSASFAIYLTHMLSLPLIAKVSTRAGLTHALPAWLGFVVLSTFAVGVGLVVHRYVEKGVIKLASSLWRPAEAAI